MLSAKVMDLAQLLDTLKAQQVEIFDVHERCVWTNYILMATTTSLAHMRGVAVQLERRCLQLDLGWRRRPQIDEGQGWVLCDAGELVINLFDRPSREFYRLEDLFFDSPRLAWQERLECVRTRG